MRFANWPFLFLLLLIPLLHRWWIRQNKKPALRFSLPIPASLRSPNPQKYLMVIRYIALCFFVFALARPQNSFKQVQRHVSGIDIMISFDVSASMNIEDLADRSRLEVAKDTVENFIRGRQTDRIGFVIFSGEALTLSPPTLDYGLVLNGLRQATIGVLRDGTAIGDGLSVAVGHLRSSQARSKVIILLTDGDNNLGQIDPATAGELAAGYEIKVYAIAIGREGRVKMPIRTRTVFGNTVTAYQWFENALNPELLQHIAKITKGKFYRVTDESALDSVFKEIDQLEKTDVKSSEKVRYEEMFPIFIKAGLLLLLIEWILSRSLWRVLP